jgi:isopenicillin-N epimerase
MLRDFAASYVHGLRKRAIHSTDLTMTAFGHALLDEFPLARDGIYLNHGTVGVTPLAVMRARAAILEDIERHPARFILRDLMSLDASTAATPTSGTLLLRAAAARVATFLGCEGDGLVFVDNATSGICAVLRSMPLEPGDEILMPDHAYGGIVRAATFIAAERGAVVTQFSLPFFAATPEAIVEALEAAITPRTRIALLDHVTSETALVMPLAAMVAVCRARGVAVLVDGAHAPGAIDVDIDALGVDWYVANLHKWAFAPRACGVLWAAPHRRIGLHPAVLSWGLTNDDWLAEFDWTGTRDPSPWLAAPAGIDFMEQRLGVDAMRDYNHDLAWRSAQSLSRHWDRPLAIPESMIGCMAAVPLPERLGSGDRRNAQRVRDVLLFEHRIEVPVIARDDALWARVSIQVYNDESDIDHLATAVDAIDRT